MGANVKFVIEGDIKAALTALDAFNKRLDATAKNPAIRGLQTTFNNIAHQIGKVNSGLKVMAGFLAQMRGGGTTMVNALNGAVRNYTKVNASTQIYIRNVTHAARQTQQLTQQTSRLQSALQSAALTAGKMGLAISKGFGKAAVGFRGSVGSGLGGIQSLGIGVRMSGIALGNQLSQIMGGALTGNFLSPVLNTLKGIINTSVGLVNIGSQMATRIVTGLAGTFVKMIGPVVGGAVNAFVGSLGAGIALSTTGLTRLLGATLSGLGDVVQNLASGITQFAGEIVIQVGNIFTGLTEVFRGAFQAAVNVAAGVLNGLVGIAGAIAEKVAGVLGKALAGVVGGVLTVGGLTLKDRMEAESAVTGATVLFDGKVTSGEKRAFRQKMMALRSEFPSLSGEGIGKAAEMLVSTGFQNDPKQAADFLRGLLPVAEVANLQNLPELARTAAKVYNLFKDEIDKASKADGMSPGAFLAGRLFQVRNVGDLEISDLASHLGEAAGVGKAFGLTLDETLSQLSQLSLGLAPDETFTAFRSIVTRLQDPAKETRELFADLGVELKVMTPEVEAQLSAIEKQRDAVEAQVASLEKVKGKQKEIAALKKQLKGLDAAEATALRRAPSRNPLEIVSQLLGLGLSEEELAIAFPNVRGLKGVAVQKALTPESKQMVADAFAQSPGGIVEGARGERQGDLAFKMERVWRRMKDSFDNFFDAVEPGLKKFVDDTALTFGRLADFTKAALADSGAAEFASNLGSKLAPLFGPLVAAFESLMKMDPAAFWGAMNSGLNATARAIEGVIGFAKTIGSIIGDIVGAAPGIQAAWEAVSGFFGAVGDGIERTSKGDKSPIVGMFTDIRDALAGLVSDAKTLLASFLVDLAGMVQSLRTTIEGIWGDVSSGGVSALTGLGAFFGVNALNGALRGGPGAVAGGAGAAGGAGGAGAAGAAGLLGKGGGALKVLGRFAAPFMAFDLASQIASGKSPGLGGASMNVLGGAGAGAAIGSAVPGLGTLIGAIVGGLAGLLPSIFGSSGEAGPNADQKRAATQAAALRMALQSGTIYDSLTGTLQPSTGSDSEKQLAALLQQQQLLGLSGGGDNIVGQLAGGLLEHQIAALRDSVKAEQDLAKQMDRWASGSMKDWLGGRVESARDAVAGIGDANVRESLAARLDEISRGLLDARTAEEAGPFREALDAVVSQTGITLTAETEADRKRARMVDILEAIEGAVSQEGAHAALSKLGIPGTKGLTPEQIAKVRGLPAGQSGKAAELQRFLDTMNKGGGAAGALAGTTPTGDFSGLVVRDGKVMSRGEAASRDKVRGLAQGLNRAADGFSSPSWMAKNDAAVSEEDRFRKERFAAKMGLKVGADGSMVSPGAKGKGGGLVKRDEMGRQYVEGPGGRRQYLAVGTADPFSGRMGRALGEAPSLGSFGMKSGRALQAAGVSGFGGFDSAVQPGSLEARTRANAKKIMGAGIQAAKNGDPQGTAEALKVGDKIVEAVENGDQPLKKYLDDLKKVLDAIMESNKEKEEIVVEKAEGTTENLETVASSVKTLRDRLDALEEREARAAEGTR